MGLADVLYEVLRDATNKLSESDIQKLVEVVTSIVNEEKEIGPKDTVLDGGKRILILDADFKYVRAVHDVENDVTHHVPAPGPPQSNDQS